MSPFLGAVPSPYPPRFGNQLHPGYPMFTPYYGPYHPGVAPFPGLTPHPSLGHANPFWPGLGFNSLSAMNHYLNVKDEYEETIEK